MSILSQKEKEEAGQRIKDMSRLTSEDKRVIADMHNDAIKYLVERARTAEFSNQAEAIQTQIDKYQDLYEKVVVHL